MDDFRRFVIQLTSEMLPRGLSFAVEVGAISTSDLPCVERAVNVLSEHALVTGPRRTHWDFRSGNMLRNGDRLVLIDPTPGLTHPYLCLAYSLVLPELHAGTVPIDLLAGYEEVYRSMPGHWTRPSCFGWGSCSTRLGGGGVPSTPSGCRGVRAVAGAIFRTYVRSGWASKPSPARSEYRSDRPPRDGPELEYRQCRSSLS